MKDKPFYDVDYCMYSDWGYKKRTRIWTNKKDWIGLKCDGSGACGNMVVVDNHKIHNVNLGRADDKLRKKHKNILPGCGSQLNQPKDLKFLGKGTNRIDRYRIPADLIYSLFLE